MQDWEKVPLEFLQFRQNLHFSGQVISPITSQKKSLSLQIKVLKDKMGHSEEVNDISFPKAQMMSTKLILSACSPH